jgi:short-subunit dehydrogenase
MATETRRKFAVVTGASSGIGFELARQCLEHDFDVLICADGAKIEGAAALLGAAGGVVIPVQADLATYDGVERLYGAIVEQHRAVDALLLNAGIGLGGEFIKTDLATELRIIALNCGHTVHLAKRVVPAMASRGQGCILMTGSVVSTSPNPYQAVYGATKAFVMSFGEALRYELKDTGVTVTALQPGATDTEFFDRADMIDTKVAEGKKDDPADVARAGFDGMMHGKDKVIAASLKSRIQGAMGEILPETTKAAMHARETKPGSAKH